MVYESVPNIEMTSLELRMGLKAFFQGVPETTYTAKELSRLTGFDTSGSCVQLRRAIKELIIEGSPIISDNNGFKLTNDPEQIKAYCQSLQHRIIGISNRINALIRNIKPCDEKQTRLIP